MNKLIKITYMLIQLTSVSCYIFIHINLILPGYMFIQLIYVFWTTYYILLRGLEKYLYDYAAHMFPVHFCSELGKIFIWLCRSYVPCSFLLRVWKCIYMIMSLICSLFISAQRLGNVFIWLSRSYVPC